VESGNKRCTGCGLEKAITDFARRSDRPCGRSSCCKKCQNIKSGAWQKNNRERKSAYLKEYRRRNPQPHRDSEKRYREQNAEKVLAQQRRWTQENKEHVRAYHRKYQKLKVRSVPELKAKQVARTREWNRRHPEKGLEYAINRRARLLSVLDEVFTREEIYERDRGKCHVCHQHAKPNNWHLDHLIPLSRGGRHARRNVAVSHPRCNLQRRNTGPAQLRLM